ncbi:MAG: hypothetical protein AAF542_08930 [Pseudomonadota bacterium]
MELRSVYWVAVLVALTSTVLADSTQEIDRQIWRPFADSFAKLDSEAFNKLHTADSLRGGPWGLQIGSDYFKSNAEHWRSIAEKGGAQSIEFSFEQRLQEAQTAYEVGYYRVTSTDSSGTAIYYGQFHVVLKKVDDLWKIAQDWDAEEVMGRKVSAEDFEKYRQKRE